MKSLLAVLVLLLVQNACNGTAIQRPCQRVSTIVGDYIHWLKNDLNVRSVSDGYALEFMREVQDSLKQYLEIDILNSTQRENFICRIFAFKNLNEVYDFMQGTPLAQFGLMPSYDILCSRYQMMIITFEEEPSMKVEFIEQLHSVMKDVVEWTKLSGFPQTFPISGDYQDSVNTLKEIEAVLDNMQNLKKSPNDPRAHILKSVALTDLVPIGPLGRWEILRGLNRTSVEDVVTWMKESPSLFVYAEKIRVNSNNLFSIGELTSSYEAMNLAKANYDKIL